MLYFQTNITDDKEMTAWQLKDWARRFLPQYQLDTVEAWIASEETVDELKPLRLGGLVMWLEREVPTPPVPEDRLIIKGHIWSRGKVTSWSEERTYSSLDEARDVAAELGKKGIWIVYV